MYHQNIKEEMYDMKAVDEQNQLLFKWEKEIKKNRKWGYDKEHYEIFGIAEIRCRRFFE